MQARAVVVREPGGPEVLQVHEVDVRDPGPGEIRVRVGAAGLNRADLLQRRGLYPAPPGHSSEILGMEFAGEVESCGAETARFRPGDRVMGIVGGAAMCELLCVQEREAVAVPAGLQLQEAAAIPEAFMTAYDALSLQVRLATAEWVLIHAVTSGVGTAAVQIVRATGARSIGTSRTVAKLKRIEACAPDATLVVPEGKFSEESRRLTGGRGVDVVLDLVGAAYLSENLASLAPQGRMIVLGLMGGVTAPMPLGVLLSQRITLIGSTLRHRPIEEKIALARSFERHLIPLFEAKRLRPVLDEVFPVDRVRAAHERMERNENVGKIVVAFST
jgi:NADPH:quinone reductase